MNRDFSTEALMGFLHSPQGRELLTVIAAGMAKATGEELASLRSRIAALEARPAAKRTGRQATGPDPDGFTQKRRKRLLEGSPLGKAVLDRETGADG